jgi:hypothetical protein
MFRRLGNAALRLVTERSLGVSYAQDGFQSLSSSVTRSSLFTTAVRSTGKGGGSTGLGFVAGGATLPAGRPRSLPSIADLVNPGSTRGLCSTGASAGRLRSVC